MNSPAKLSSQINRKSDPMGDKKQGSIRVMLEIGMPAPQPPKPVEKKNKEPVEDRIREALELIDSGHESGVEWRLVNRVYADLCKLKKPTDRANALKKMIEPVLAKFGYHGISTIKP